MEKMLPSVRSVEESVLAHLLIYPDDIVSIVDILTPSDFYVSAHHLIYETMCALYEANRPIDAFIVTDELERQGHLIDVDGGPDYLIQLQCDILLSVNLRGDAEIIARKAYQRRLIGAGANICAVGYEGGESISHMREKASRLLAALDRGPESSDLESIADILKTCCDEIEQAAQLHSPVVGVPTGFTDLDRMTGGFQKSDLIILAGRPGMGKSAFAMGVAYNAALAGHPVAVFSLEMGKRQLGQRLLSLLSGIPTDRLRKGWIRDEEWGQIVEAQGTISALPIYIDDTSGSPVLSIEAKMRRKQREIGAAFDLLVVDYLGLMDLPGEDAKRKENRNNEIDAISKGLKGLAKKFTIPVVTLAQLNRAVEGRQSKVPQLSDLRDSGGVEQNADIVTFVYRDDYYNSGVDENGNPNSKRPGTADIIVAKHRNGPTGEVTLKFDAARTRFDNLEGTPT